jgi:hypothetical protein
MAMLLKADGTKELIPEELTLEYMQWLVGGYIEMVAPAGAAPGAVLIVHEEGRYQPKLRVNEAATRLWRGQPRQHDGVLFGDVISAVCEDMGKESERYR